MVQTTINFSAIVPTLSWFIAVAMIGTILLVEVAWHTGRLVVGVFDDNLPGRLVSFSRSAATQVRQNCLGERA
jgi:hypothetical protein